ncbi:hypothetical protein [Vibrio sp. Hep-1b-8]|uniref:hypothetical protein n=1 Tax=Vibrio sp. Hep-1b-8 TaxID=2144187 RepID=UPI001110595E|nr:hypothetical protein [Vibrio sp. Hep-1b-8]TMX35212.1 hypothetical protein DA100_14375 [Vibrio sp. Hep-1b-8]
MSDIEVSQLDMGLIRTGTEGSPQNHIVASNSNRNPGRDRDPERNPGTGGTNKPKEVGEPKVEPTVKPKVGPTIEPPSQKYQWGNEDLAGEMDQEVRNEALRDTMDSLIGVEDFVDAAETVLDANATIAEKVVAVGGAFAKRTPLGKGVSKAVTKKGLPENPNDLLKRGYKETSHPDAAKRGHRTFENSDAGDKLRFDQGKQGANGFEGKDHYHRYNPDATGKQNQYLDKNGNPCARGCDASHLLPGD